MKSPFPRQREAASLRAVLQALRAFGVDCERQNTGGMSNEKGQYVAFGQSGNTDITGMMTRGPWRGRRVDVEVKRPGFDPKRPGSARARQRWQKQLERIQRTNRNGGIAFWATSADEVAAVMTRVNEGLRVVVEEDGTVYVTDEEQV